MKKKLIVFAIFALVVVTAFAFRSMQSSITGKISPADGAESVWAIGTSDSVKAPVTSGTFNITVKPGTYKVIVDAREPRKDVVLDNVEVKNQPVDVGEIVIQ